MTQNDFVTLDVATTLREKGYDEKCRGYYYEGKFNFSDFGNSYNKRGVDYLIDAPLQYEVQKWLRENHDIEISISCIEGRAWGADMWRISTGTKIEFILDCCPQIRDTYEEALNAGIKEALKVI